MADDLMNSLVREKLGIELRELAGTIVAGELPLRADVVNRVVAHQLARSDGGAIERVEIAPRDGNRIDVALTLKARFVPAVKIEAVVEQQPVFPTQPVLVLRWAMPMVGPLAALAAPIVTSFKSLPPGVRLDGERVTIDVAELLRARGLGEVVPCVVNLRVTTREGSFFIEFATRIPE